jgi:L-histidine Nalpha-methyltransferase
VPQPVTDAMRPSAVASTNEAHQSTQSSLMGRLETILRKADFAWSLGLIGEDQAAKLAMLTGDLRRHVSTIGDGKRITSGFSYLGAEPAIAWTKACRDHLYPVMKQSIESFDRRWEDIRPNLEAQPYHYVSLGPGDGQKDAVILHDLERNNAQLCYVAVDMSAEMLRLGVHPLVRQLKLSRNRVLPVQLDFSSRANVTELRRLLHGLFDRHAILFSLLGNTTANFENDTEMLRMFVEELLRPQDRFVVEVATTRKLDEAMAQEAAEEYEHSRTFREFVTSALMHYTDLKIDMEDVLFQGGIEEGRALQIKILYQNRTGKEIRVTLPDRTTVPFPQQDTIRLYMSRKYVESYLEALPVDSGICVLDRSHFDLRGGSHSNAQFGIDLLMFGAGSETAQQDASRTLAEYTWARK